jgi:hypothetical protein
MYGRKEVQRKTLGSCHQYLGEFLVWPERAPKCVRSRPVLFLLVDRNNLLVLNIIDGKTLAIITTLCTWRKEAYTLKVYLISRAYSHVILKS